MQQLFAERALLPDGWARDVRLDIDDKGELLAVTPGADWDGAERLAGPVMPGIPNLHSHAFQRAMAGLAERAAGEDSFWSWREVMYRFVGSLTPEQVEAIAAQLYLEMLKAGYTSVGEFHYLHHDPEGLPYQDVAEMAWRVLSAARRSGIGCTLLPVLYGYGGFGGRPAGAGQRRFLNEPERLLRLIAKVREATADDPQVRVGLAPHSLRAVTPETLRDVLSGLNGLDPRAPIHIHVAEQMAEVDACNEWTGKRPVEYLLDGGAELDERWCLVHCTHTTEDEVRRLAATGAVAGLCPTTEANLGDGLFPAADFLAAGGRFGIGSDSHISISPVEELRWLEYGQRLFAQQRNVLQTEAHGGSVGATLVHGALAGGAQALGRPIGRLAAGYRADLVVLDDGLPTLAGRTDEQLLDAVVFAGNENPVRDVMAGGRWVVRDRRHEAEREVLDGYRTVVAELLGEAA
ncbi:formimidoylglutamate deiminase [Ferruginivarius sediminum]|uniref:Formimidoylglutamate deiminase n=1 Tax=Ferruginivarius sediminum TaxID=2661937 RepID=A0A369TF95_9PROT|nr:formimidoylglutamate deiminase [Ferruginivarius sediminum]RDD63938.1 formimidoylglutamate deiminase [Ferruginivarius sediminum]